MLQQIRERISGIVAIIIFGFLGILLIPFGAQNFNQVRTPDAVARVGDSDVTRTEFETSFNNYRQRLRQLLGANFDEFAYSQPLVRRQHLESVIDQRLLELYAQDSGLAIPPAQLTETVQGIPAFQVAGIFNETIYRQALANQRLDEASFLSDLRGNLATQALSGSLQTSVQPTETEIDAMLELQNQTRNIDYALFPASVHLDSVTIDDAEVEAYYNENSNQFMQPEQVALSYVEVDAADFSVTEELDEQLLQDRYEANVSRFITPERRQASHILLTLDNDADEQTEADAQSLAESLVQRIRDGEDFAALAEEFSQDPGTSSTGGDLGWIDPGNGIMPQNFEDTLYALEDGAVSDPVRTGFGYHVILLTGIEPSTGKSFEDAREELEEEARADLAERQYLDVADELVDLSFEQPDALQPVADELGLDLQETELFSRTGGAGLTARPEIIEAAFSDLLLLEQSNSDPIQLGPNHMVVARVSEHVPATPRPLEEVEVEVRNILQRQKASQLAREEAEAALAAATAEGSTLEQAIAAIAAPVAIETDTEADTETDTGTEADDDNQAAASPAVAETALVHEENLSRNDFQLGQTFLEAVFAMNLGADQTGVIQAVPQNGQDWAIVRLNSITSGDPTTASEAERQRLSQQLQRSLVSEERTGLLDQLRERYEITVYEDRL